MIIQKTYKKIKLVSKLQKETKNKLLILYTFLIIFSNPGHTVHHNASIFSVAKNRLTIFYMSMQSSVDMIPNLKMEDNGMII